MDIDKYFDHLASDDIRIKGTRIGIESVLYEYIHREQSPEAIANSFPSLTLEKVYATILYYLQNKQAIDAYMTDWLEYGRRMREKQDKNPPPVIIRLRELKAQRQQADSIS
ncbi:MAG: DUF433 domain-containing protein [Candidatus Aminicenantes bacterium]|nr:DUF433 domain-containing protein [Candidatus Aminicenantes bacterium]NIM80155.1 DUF433 domain-containing protein [Candidatus Aminicenantes bacterium]NIN19493.1 DUF433 domain-containing protein [Candidatus Aminicenantes bacterium]NIN43392.1 DUF433 domain-containing protein [Candidatus Aminicenantes bacterium]NIN86137.1 DUF433 domain-containing protein [Candidatus Aminicenantes bacterium]